MFTFSSGLLFESGGADGSSFAAGALGAGGGGAELAAAGGAAAGADFSAAGGGEAAGASALGAAGVAAAGSVKQALKGKHFKLGSGLVRAILFQLCDIF